MPDGGFRVPKPDSPDLAELRLLTEIQRRRECRASFLRFCTDALAPIHQTPAAHHRLLIRELEAVTRGDVSRLMVNMPPGSAKSTYASVLFPAWFLAQRPRLSVIGASNTMDLAASFSRRAMGVVRDHSATLGYGLTRNAVELWETTNRGAYRAAGMGGTITGNRSDLTIIDDPIRTRADANSDELRQKQWDWFTGDLRTRSKPNAAIVVIMTRWHEDDLGGRLIARQPGLWRVISLPAIAGADDALGRAPGDWLWGDDAYGYQDELHKVHAEYEAAGAMRDWSSLYQQDPRPLEGSLFKVAQMATVTAAGEGQTVRAWDFAATEQVGTRNPDWSVGVKLRRVAEGRFVVMDVTRLRGGPEDVLALLLATAQADGRNVTIGLPQDPGQAGKWQVKDFTTRLAGYRVESSPESGDKATRAGPVASQVNVGNVSLYAGDWNAPFREELRSFPGAAKDDQVDALSRAFGMLVAPRTMTVRKLGY